MHFEIAMVFIVFLTVALVFYAIGNNRNISAGSGLIFRLKDQIIFKALNLNNLIWNIGFYGKNQIFKRCDLYATKDFIILIGHNNILGLKIYFRPVVLSKKKLRRNDKTKNMIIIENFEVRTRGSIIRFELEHHSLFKSKVNFGIHKLPKDVIDSFDQVLSEHFNG